MIILKGSAMVSFVRFLSSERTRRTLSVVFTSCLLVAALFVLALSQLSLPLMGQATAGDWNPTTDFTTNGTIITGLTPAGEANLGVTGYTLDISDISGFDEIADFAFQAKGLTSVSLPSDITTVGKLAFADNVITALTLADPGLTDIGAQAFVGNKLTEVALPASVVTLATDAFDSNGRVVKVTTTATLTSHFSAGNGYVINPVTMTAKMKDVEDGTPVGDGTKVLGTNFASAELFPAGVSVTIQPPKVTGWKPITAAQTVTASQGLVIDFEYENVQFAPIITVSDKLFVTGNPALINEATIRSWATIVSGVDGVTPLLASQITVIPTSINSSVPGTHQVSYVAVDGAGNSATKTITVSVGPDPMDAYIGSSVWQYKDFIYGNSVGTAGQLQGFSASGVAKYNPGGSGERNLTLPGINPTAGALFGTPLTQITNQSSASGETGNTFRNKQFTAIDFSHITALRTIGTYAFSSHVVSALDLSSCVDLETISDQSFYGISTNPTLSSIVFDNPKLTTIGPAAFMYHTCSELDFSMLPSLEIIDNAAFKGSASNATLTSIIFDNPKLTVIETTMLPSTTGTLIGAFANHRLTSLDLSKLPSLERLGNSAFAGMSSNPTISSVIFDNPKLHYIGDSAFRYHQFSELDFTQLPSLKTIVNTAFDGISSSPTLRSIYFDNPKLTEIGSLAFRYHFLDELDLTSLSSLESIGSSAFAGSSNTSYQRLTSVTFDNPKLKSIEASAFQNHRLTKLDFSRCPELKTIGNSAFGGVSNFITLTELVFDNPKLTDIGQSAFANHRIAALDFSACAELGTIGSSAFTGSSVSRTLATITFDNPKLSVIGGYAFQYHILTTLDLSLCPALNTIGSSAFAGASSAAGGTLLSIIFDNPNLQTIDSAAFQYHKLTALDFSLCPALVTIGGSAFFGNQSSVTLSSITFNNPKLTTIGGGAFVAHRCTILDFSMCPELKTIGNNAFTGISSNQTLSSLILDNPKLTTIGSQAFIYHRLGTIDFSLCPELTSIGSQAFANIYTTLGCPASITFDNPKLATIDDEAFARGRLTGMLDLSASTGLVSIGNNAFQLSNLTGIVIGGTSPTNTTGNLYNVASVPSSNGLQDSDKLLPIWILNNTANITSNYGYRINPLNVIAHFVEDNAGLPGPTIAPSRILARLSAPVSGYALNAPYIYGYSCVNSPEIINEPATPAPGVIFEKDVTFRYTPLPPGYYNAWQNVILQQTAVRAYGEIGTDLHTTIRLANSAGSGMTIPAGYQIEIYYDQTRVNPNNIRVSNSTGFTVDTTQPGKLVLTLSANFTAGTDRTPAIIWQLLPGPTEENVQFPLYAQLVDTNGEPWVMANPISLSGWYQRPYITKYANGQSLDYQPIYFGYTNSDGSFSGSEPKSITYTYSLSNMKRNVEQVILMDYLPTYTTVIGGVPGTATAVMDPLKNPGWVDNLDGTVTYILPVYNTTAVQLPKLILDFPDIAADQLVTNKVSFFAKPWKMASTESVMTGSDPIISWITGQPTLTGIFNKSPQRLWFWDFLEEKQERFGWTLSVYGYETIYEASSNTTKTVPLPTGQYYSNVNLSDDSLDPRMQYLSVNVGDFKGATVTAYDSGGNVLFQALNQNGDVVFPALLRPNIVRVEITGSKVKIASGAVARAYIYSEIKDPVNTNYVNYSTPTPNDKDGNGLYFANTGYLTDATRYNAAGTQIGTLGQIGSRTWTEMRKFDGGVGVSKSNTQNSGHICLPGDSITWRLNLDIYNGTQRILSSSDIPKSDFVLTNVVIYDVIPQDLTLDAAKPFVPSAALMLHSTNLKWEIIPANLPSQPNDLLKITADTLKPYRLAASGGLTANLGTLNGTVSMLAPDGLQLINHVYLDYAGGPFAKQGPKAPNTSNPFNSNTVLWDSDKIGVAATKEMITQKEVRVRKDPSTWDFWTNTGVKTKPLEEFQYRLRVRNNSSTNRSGLSLVDALPFAGDNLIDNPNIPRMSQFANTLKDLNSIKVYHYHAGGVTQLIQGTHYTLEYMITPVNKTALGISGPDTYFDTQAVWVPAASVTVSDLPNITAFRINAVTSPPPGFVLGIGEELEVIVDVKAPADPSQQLVDMRAYNSFVRRDNNVQTSYLEAPPVYNEIPDKLAQITLTKKGDGGVNLPGVVFGLYTPAGQLVQVQTTNASGVAVFANIPRADYYIQEISNPNSNYVAGTAKFNVKATDFLAGASWSVPYTYSLTVTNVLKPKFGNLQIFKKDALGAAFAGVSFKVQLDTSPYTSYTMITNTAGMGFLGNLPVGTYTVTELSSAGKLDLLAPFKVTVGEFSVTLVGDGGSGLQGGRITKDGSVAIQINAINNLASVKVMKLGLIDESLATTDAVHLSPSSGIALGGVSLQLFKVNSDDTTTAIGLPQITATSGTNLGTVSYSGLDVGQLYGIAEVSAPANYETLDTPVYFRIDERGRLFDEKGELYQSGMVMVKNMREEQKGTLVIEKTDASNETTKLAGAIFKLEKWDESLLPAPGWVFVTNLTTTAPGGKASLGDLSCGIYRVSETEAPLGYIKTAQTQTFVIDKYALNQLVSFKFKNTLLDPRLVKGVFVQNYNLAIPTQAAAFADALAYLSAKYGSSLVYQIKQPDNTVTLVVGLAGAVFEMKEFAGASVDASDLLGTYTLVSDANGRLRFAPPYENFVFTETNTYVFKETIPPAGYALRDEIITWRPVGEAASLIASGGIKWFAFENRIDNHRIVISKTDTDTAQVLAGAVFELLYPNGKSVFYNSLEETTTFTTDSNGRIEINDLPTGTYYLREVAAPGPSYILPEGYWKIVIVGEEGVTLTDPDPTDVIGTGGNTIFSTTTSGGMVFLHIKNERKVEDRFRLPLTGGAGMALLALAATVLGLLAWFVRKGATQKTDVSHKTSVKLRAKTSAALSLLLVIVLLLNLTGLAHADINVNPNQKGSITLHKYLLDDMSHAGPASDGQAVSGLPSGAKPLSNVSFSVCRVIADTGTGAEVLATVEGTDWISATPSFETVITTAGNGQALLSNLSKGYYLITELPSSKTEEVVSPFIISLPTFIDSATDPSGFEQVWDVHAYPKNRDLSITKVIEHTDNSTSAAHSTHIGDETTWLVTADIPTKIESAKAYLVTDTYSEGLVLVAGSVNVRALSLAGSVSALSEGEDYTLSVTAPQPLGGGSVEVDFTTSGRAKLAGYAKVELRLKTIILESAALSTPLYNGAELVFTNASNATITRDTKTEPDPETPETIGPEVHTGGVRLLKTDAKTGAALQGAQFKVVPKLSASFKNDLAASGYVKRGGQDYLVTTDAQGRAEIRGLSYGNRESHLSGQSDYWLVEVKAPTGYALPKDPVVIRIDASSFANTQVKYTITNEKSPLGKVEDELKKIKPPKAGDWTSLLALAALVSGAIYILAKTKSKKTKLIRGPDEGGEISRR